MREHLGCDLANAVRWVIIPCLRKQDKRFVVSRINRIERALFNNQIGYRGYAAELPYRKETLPYSYGANIALWMLYK